MKGLSIFFFPPVYRATLSRTSMALRNRLSPRELSLAAPSFFFFPFPETSHRRFFPRRSAENRSPPQSGSSFPPSRRSDFSRKVCSFLLPFTECAGTYRVREDAPPPLLLFFWWTAPNFLVTPFFFSSASVIGINMDTTLFASPSPPFCEDSDFPSSLFTHGSRGTFFLFLSLPGPFLVKLDTRLFFSFGSFQNSPERTCDMPLDGTVQKRPEGPRFSFFPPTTGVSSDAQFISNCNV